NVSVTAPSISVVSGGQINGQTGITLTTPSLTNNGTIKTIAASGVGITAQSTSASLTISGAGQWTTSGASVNFQNTTSSTASVIFDNSTQTITGGGVVNIVAP